LEEVYKSNTSNDMMLRKDVNKLRNRGTHISSWTLTYFDGNNFCFGTTS